MRFVQVLAPIAVALSGALAQDTTTDVTTTVEVTSTTKVTETTTQELHTRSETGKATTVTTVITSDYVTYCPSPTTFVHKNITFTAHSATHITITNCPCTVVFTTTPPGPGPTHPTIAPPKSPQIPPSHVPSAPPSPPSPPSPPHKSPEVPPVAPPVAPPPKSPPSSPPQAPPASPPQAPPVETHIAHTQKVTPGVPIAPTATSPETVPTGPVAAANKANAGFGALVIAGVAAMMM